MKAKYKKFNEYFILCKLNEKKTFFLTPKGDQLRFSLKEYSYGLCQRRRIKRIGLNVLHKVRKGYKEVIVLNEQDFEKMLIEVEK